MKKKVLRFLAVLLIFSICTSLLPESVFAVTAEEPVEETTPTMADFIAGTATAEDIYGVLDPSIVPAAIDYNEAVEKNHIARCYEDEGTDLNKIIFLNIDGTKTMYTFDFPVKYVDDNGNIQDIRLEIADSAVNAGAFETAANNTVTTFSAQFTDGITLEGNDTEIRLIPILPAPDLSATLSTTDMVATTATAQRIDADTVAYPYDAKTTVEYSLTYTGFKEDIVVSEYTGQTEYPFRLLTNGLALEEIGGSFFLVDDQGNIEASIGDIIIFTADERNNAFGDIEPKTIVENQEYLLNIVVDAEYLADPATTYPIRIDPTVKINYNYGAGAVEDITISTNTNFSGSYDYLFVGRRQTEGIARILMRFPGLDMSQLAGATVTDAHVRIRDMMCEDVPLDVSCHIFTGNVWAESSATWANCSPNSYVSTPLSTNTLKWSIGNTFSNKHWYQFDVTEAVQGWVNGNYSQNKGFLFKVASTVENGSTIQNRTFGSYNRTNYRPSLTVTYTEPDAQLLENDTYYLNNRGTGKYLQLSTSGTANGVSGLLSSLGNRIQWQIQKVGSGYVIRSVNDPTKYLSCATSSEDSSVYITTIQDATIPPNCIWSVTAASGGDYLIQNSASGNYLCSSGTSLYAWPSTGSYGSASYETYVWRAAKTSAYGDTSAYSTQQMTDTVSISNMECSVGDIIDIQINKVYTNELWCEATDFTYSFEKSGVATYSNGKMNLLQYGGTKVQATHKVTGRVKTFYILVGFSTTATSTPLADHIVAGLNQPHDVWPASEESRYYTYSTMNRAEALTDIHEMALLTIVGGWATANINAASMLAHFLNNKGTRYDVGMKQMLSEWDTARNFRERDMNYVMQAVEASAAYSDKTLRTTTSLGCTVNESTNWGRAVGSYTTSIVCTYKKTSSTSYTMQITYELHDVYDWDRTITSMGNLPVSPRDMWELHHGGLAKNYEVFGQNTFTLTWTQGQTFGEGAVMSNEA